MNLLHRRICRSDSWATRMHGEVLPWACRTVPLDGDVLEIGPGYGVTTRAGLGDRVDVHTGDGAALPFPDESFDTVVCFTMLHHVPSPEQQDQLFAEAARVLRPGGVFAGLDSRLNLRFRLIHIGDTMTVVDPDGLPDRLSAAGLSGIEVDTVPRAFRFRATR